MASLMPLRSDLLRGDLRCLYLGWLRCAQDGGLDENKLEPPVPAGLEELSGPLHALIEFLEIDEDLVEVAAQASKPLAAGPSRRELSAWIRGLPEKDKDELLITAAVDQGERWRNELVRRFRRATLQQASEVLAAGEQRNAGDLLAAADARAKERARLLNEQRTAEAAKRREEDLANRARYLDQLGNRQVEIWKQVAAHLQTRQPKDYDRAVSLLTDLQTSPSAVARQPDFKRRWRRSGKYTLPRRASCAVLPRQICRHKKFTRPCQWRVPKWLDRFDARNRTQSSRGLRPFRNRCLHTIAPRTENECRTGCGSQDSGRSRGFENRCGEPISKKI